MTKRYKTMALLNSNRKLNIVGKWLIDFFIFRSKDKHLTGLNVPYKKNNDVNFWQGLPPSWPVSNPSRNSMFFFSFLTSDNVTRTSWVFTRSNIIKRVRKGLVGAQWVTILVANSQWQNVWTISPREAFGKTSSVTAPDFKFKKGEERE